MRSQITLASLVALAVSPALVAFLSHLARSGRLGLGLGGIRLQQASQGVRLQALVITPIPQPKPLPGQGRSNQATAHKQSQAEIPAIHQGLLGTVQISFQVFIICHKGLPWLVCNQQGHHIAILQAVQNELGCEIYSGCAQGCNADAPHHSQEKIGWVHPPDLGLWITSCHCAWA